MEGSVTRSVRDLDTGLVITGTQHFPWDATRQPHESGRFEAFYEPLLLHSTQDAAMLRGGNQIHS
ncbi:hypothetical protein E2C01_066376 [Portunus trituberculatus]|uniref:Uncharacterized protein n=1 Tax=Portunus trituberculatus TaxID=210409 RepID=A0A5B7HPL4_PORTR|nr:hypothetical protein [Portunus trituberculatus]